MVVYARSDTSRKAQFQVLTTIEKDTSNLLVRKKPLTRQSIGHVANMLDHYKSLQQKNLPFRLCRPALAEDGAITFNFIQGTTLDAKFADLIFTGRAEEACQVLDKMLSLVNKLSGRAEDFDNNTGFKSVFGDAYASRRTAATIGNLDFNLDNMLEEDKQLWLIDYEWVFNFSLPVDFIASRLVADAFWRTNDYFMLAGSEKDRVVSINDRVFVSKTLFKRYRKYFEQIPLVMSSDEHFQYYVRGGQKPQSSIKLIVKEFTNPPFPGLSQKISNLERAFYHTEHALSNLKKEHERAVELLRQEEAKAIQMRRQLNRIYAHPVFRMFNSLRKSYRKLFAFRK